MVEEEKKNGLYISKICIYPIKSCRGLELKESNVDRLGLELDRRWMIVDKDNKFVTCRQYPKMVLITPSFEFGADNKAITMRLDAPNMGTIEIPVTNESGCDDSEKFNVEIWGTIVQAKLASDKKTSKWLSEYLGFDARLITTISTRDHSRELSPIYDTRSQRGHAAFSDAYPILLATENSFDEVNKRLPGDQIPMTWRNFRPNIVVAGTKKPFSEDYWSKININGIEFNCVKPCDRCTVPTINPETGVRKLGEPTKTLKTFRGVNDDVFFGENITPLQCGKLKVGDAVSVITTHTYSLADRLAMANAKKKSKKYKEQIKKWIIPALIIIMASMTLKRFYFSRIR